MLAQKFKIILDLVTLIYAGQCLIWSKWKIGYMLQYKYLRLGSWKNISCSIRGEAAFWNPIAIHVAISKGNSISVLNLKFTALVCHIRNVKLKCSIGHYRSVLRVVYFVVIQLRLMGWSYERLVGIRIMTLK